MSASDTPRKRRLRINAATRKHLVVLARRSSSRSKAFTTGRPTKWHPTQVRNPNGVLDTHFTDATAWEFIASRLEAGEEVEVIDLQKPPGTKGYVMKIDLGSGLPELYVKLQLVSARIIGRSFHYSEQTWEGDRS